MKVSILACPCLGDVDIAVVRPSRVMSVKTCLIG